MNSRDALESADEKHVAVGHFNISDLVGFNAAIAAARPPAFASTHFLESGVAVVRPPFSPDLSSMSRNSGMSSRCSTE